MYRLKRALKLVSIHCPPAPRSAGIVILTVLSAPAIAQSGAAPMPVSEPPPPALDSALRPSEGMHFRITPDVWIPRLEGDLSFGGSTVDFGDDLSLDSTEATFDGVAEFRFDPWVLSLSGFSFGTDGSATATTPRSFGGLNVATGEQIHSEFDLDSAALEFGATLWRPLADQVFPWSERVRNEDNVAYNGDYRTDLRFTPYVGARWLGLEQSFLNETTGGTSSFDADWLAIYGGLRMELAIQMPKNVPLLQRMVISAGGAFGGVVSGGSGTMTQVRAGLDLFLMHNVALSAGYQLLDLDADEDDYEINGGLQGLWFGLTIWF